VNASTQWEEEDRLRTNLYGLMAGLLARPPKAELLRLLDVVRADATVDRPLAHCWRDLQDQAAGVTAGELEGEFQSLFIGLGRGEVVPYGSYYLSGRLMDKPLARLRGDLAELGIERRPEIRETEDHAAALCETMALISDPQTGVSGERQQAFYSHHLASWMPRFFTDLQAAPSAFFYRTVGRVGKAFMALERNYFSDMRCRYEEAAQPL
jgi:TorA maturation chaperone TorD